MKKIVAALCATAFALGAAAPAMASEARIHISAHVPTRCEMNFNGQISPLSGSSFMLGTVQQFCNTQYQMTLLHAPAPNGMQFQFGDKVVAAGSQSTIVETLGKPTNGSKQLVALGLDQADAAAISGSMVLQVTPISF